MPLLAHHHDIYALDAACLAAAQPTSLRPPLKLLRHRPDEPELTAAKDGTAIFTTTLISDLGDPRFYCFDYIKVSATSGTEPYWERAVPRVLATPHGYRVSVALWPTVTKEPWTISAHLVWHAFDREGWRHNYSFAASIAAVQAKEAKRATQLQHEAEAVAIAHEAQAEASSTASAHDEGAAMAAQRRRLEIPPPAGSKEWNSYTRDDTGCIKPFDAPLLFQMNVSIAREQPTAPVSDDPFALPPCGRADLPKIGLRANSTGATKIEFWHKAMAWPTPPGCAPIVSGGARARAALGGKWILFMGQSTLLEHFGHLIATMLRNGKGRDTPYHSSWSGTAKWSTDDVFAAHAIGCRPNYSNRDWDLKNGSKLFPPRTRMTIFYNGAASPCGGTIGLPSVLNPPHLAHLYQKKQSPCKLPAATCPYFKGDEAEWMQSAADVTPVPRGASSEYVLQYRGKWLRSLLSGGNSTPWEHLRGCPIRPRPRCHEGYGNTSEKLSHIASLVQTGATRGWPNGPDAVVLAAGPHDFGSRLFTLDSWEAHLKALWALVEDATAAAPEGTKPHVIWMSMGGIYTRSESAAELLNRSFCPNDKVRCGQSDGA